MMTGVGRDVLNEIKAFREKSKEEFPFTPGLNEAEKIKTALNRYAGIHSDSLDVFVDGDAVILRGMVNSQAHKEDAENIVFMVMPGITRVDNNLNVNIEYAGAEVYEF